jgi:hypothetical protein
MEWYHLAPEPWARVDDFELPVQEFKFRNTGLTPLHLGDRLYIVFPSYPQEQEVDSTARRITAMDLNVPDVRRVHRAQLAHRRAQQRVQKRVQRAPRRTPRR